MALFVSGKLFNKAGEGSGGGGGDQHNLGWYATQSALETAYPTATAGDWAIVGSTDTVWIWDTDNSAWVDSDQKGQVTSVNNRTGAVTVSEVPSQTGQSGKFLTTDGTDASWGEALKNGTTYAEGLAIIGQVYSTSGIAIGYNSIAYTRSTAIGAGAVVGGTNAIAIGYGVSASGNSGIAIGRGASASGNNSIQMSTNSISATNSDANTFKVANANGNYEIMSADGTVPTDRFTTTPSVAGTYSATIVVDGQGNITRSWATAPDPLPSQTGNAGKVLMTNGTTASWEDVSSSPATMPELTVAGWSLDSGTNKYTQSVSVTGVTGTNIVFVSPTPSSAADYASSSVLCISQTTDSLTFQADSVPSNAITVNVVIL